MSSSIIYQDVEEWRKLSERFDSTSSYRPGTSGFDNSDIMFSWQFGTSEGLVIQNQPTIKLAAKFLYLEPEHLERAITFRLIVSIVPQNNFDWLIDWWFDWLIEWLMNWLLDWLMDWLIDQWIDWLFDWLNFWSFTT